MLCQRWSTKSSAALKVPRTLSTLSKVARCAFLLLCCCNASAQATSNIPVLHQAESIGANEPDEQWAFSASVYVYFPPKAGNYLQPTLTADHDWLHLEVRYNYEELDTGSAWVGYNFGGGDKMEWEFSPMLGAVFGKLSGVAPGYRGSLSWRRLELYSEGEYIIDTVDSSASYFYNWSELSLSLLERFRVGAVIQHTHVYQTDREIQRGVLVGLSYKRADLTGYVFNPDDHNPTVVIALSVSW
jgi:hypothetical protein